jgi:hypothetical protein
MDAELVISRHLRKLHYLLLRDLGLCFLLGRLLAEILIAQLVSFLFLLKIIICSVVKY